MKLKSYKSLFLTVGFIVGFSCQPVWAQEPPTPASDSGSGVPTFVFLKQDYVDALKSSKVVSDNLVVATFVRFDSDFAVFKRPESRALVYIPKTAILYISAKPDAQIKY